MSKMIIISLPVADLAESTAFYEALGFTNNRSFSSETSAYMVWSETIHVMLATHEAWKTFTNRPIAPATHSEVGLKISVDSRDAVDAINQAAADHGGIADINPAEDHGFMYCRDLLDPDGHVWGAMWMDPAAMPSG